MEANSNNADFRIPPNIFFGVFALTASFLTYIVSSTSFGKRSLSHTWLFSGLLVIHPSEESLKKIAPTTSETAVTPKRKNNASVKDVSGLELTCKPILPGAIPLSVMTEKRRVTFQQWQALDAAVCVWMACLFALAGPFLLAWYTLYQDKIVCCDDLKCWLEWWRDQLGGAGLIFETSSPPAHSMSVFLAGLSLWFWWRLVLHSTRLPERGIFMYSPFSYINGWMTLFATLFLLQLTYDANSGYNRPFLGIPLSAALEELSTRATLWLGLTGFYSPEVDESQQVVLGNIRQMTHLAFAFLVSLLGFAIADPLRQTMLLYWGSICGDEVYIKDTTKGKLVEWMLRKQKENALLSVAFLPILCMSTYMIQLESYQHFSPRAIRTILGWCFICNLGILVRPLEQKYLLQALSAADDTLNSSKRLTLSEIKLPFQYRSQKILSTGSQLLVFPAMILILLTLGHGAGLPPVALSNNQEGLTTGIYPFGFYHSLWTDREEKEFQAWSEFQAKASAHVALHDETIIAELTATRANIGLCRDNVSFSFLALPEDRLGDFERSGHVMSKEYAAPIFRVDSASQLISSKALIKTTFVQMLRRLQDVVKKTRSLSSQKHESDSSGSQNRKAKEKQSAVELEENEKSQNDLNSILQALIFHPFLTSTVILPVLDFFGLMLCFLWVMYFLWYGIRSWPERKHRRRYVLQIQGEGCCVVAIQRARTSRMQEG